MDHRIIRVKRKSSSRTKMTALLASLPLQVVCQLLVPGHPHVTENGTLVGSKIQRRTSPVDLPEGYVSFFEDQTAYKIHEELATWNEARELCMSEGAYLAIADSRRKIINIKSINNQSDSWLHVGIYNAGNSDQWIRVDNGLPVTSLPWAYDDSDHTGSCAGISLLTDGLVDYFCSGKEEYFVCEIPLTGDSGEGESTNQGKEITEISGDSNSSLVSIEDAIPTTEDPYVTPTEDYVSFHQYSNEEVSTEPTETIEPTPTSLPENISQGYVAFPEDHAAYKIHREDATWYEGRDKCILEGARLAIPDSVDKIKNIKSLEGDWGAQWLHVGIRKSETTGQWVRIDTDLPASSIPWSEYSPDNDGDCVGIALGGDYLLNYDCKRTGEFFVCEIPM